MPTQLVITRRWGGLAMLLLGALSAWGTWAIWADGTRAQPPFILGLCAVGLVAIAVDSFVRPNFVVFTHKGVRLLGRDIIPWRDIEAVRIERIKVRVATYATTVIVDRRDGPSAAQWTSNPFFWGRVTSEQITRFARQQIAVARRT